MKKLYVAFIDKGPNFCWEMVLFKKNLKCPKNCYSTISIGIF